MTVRRHFDNVRQASDAAAGNTWDRAILVARFRCKLVEIGIVPDASFGQPTNYAILTFKKNTVPIGSKSYTSAVSAYTYDGITVTPTELAVGDVIRLQKTIGGTGQIVPAHLVVCVIALFD